MSVREIELCSIMLKDYFGESVDTVGKYLMTQVCPRPLLVICKNIPSVPRTTVNTVLRFLLQHNFADFTLNPRGFVEYSIRSDRVLHLLYYQRYIYHMKFNFGDIAELFMEEFFMHGRLTMSNIIKHVGEKLYEANETEYTPQKLSEIRNEFKKLVQMKFFRCAGSPQPTGKPRVPVLGVNEQELYIVPEIQLHLLNRSENSESPPQKKLKAVYPDDGIYWQLDLDRFSRFMRDQIIVEGVLNGVDKKASELVKSMLALAETKPVGRNQLWASTSVPVANHEILNSVKHIMNPREFEQYLKVLSEDERSFISKVDDRSGGMFVVNIKKILAALAEEIAASVVQERFGSKSCRIFRVLLKKKYLEQKQLEELSMISPKEAKEFTYRMMKECFVTTQEICKTADYSAGRTFFLFHVELNQVCRMMVEHCYKAAANCMICLDSQKRDQRRLLDKKFRLDAIVATLEQSGATQEEVEEVMQMITPPEKVILEKTIKICDKLNRSLTQLGNMIFVLRTFLQYLPST